MSLESKLTAKVEAKGAKEAADAIRSVGEAQADVAGKAKGATEQVKGQTEAQTGLNASEGDFISLLSNINPQMGLYGDLVLKATKVLNTAGDSSINLTRVMGGLRNVIMQNIGALKFFAASGALIAGIAAIASAFEKIKKEAQEANETFQEISDRADEVVRNRQTAIENLAQDTAKKRGGILTVDELKGIQREAEKAQELAPGASKDLIRQAAASLGPGATAKEIAQGAVAQESFDFKFNDEQTAERQQERLRTTVRRTPGIDQRIAQQKELKKESFNLDEIAKELSTQGGSTANIQAFAESLPGGVLQDVDPKQIARIVVALQGISGKDVRTELLANLSPFSGGVIPSLSEDDALRELVDQEVPLGKSGDTKIAAAQFITQQIESAFEKRRESRQTNVTQHFNNTRVTTPGPNRNRQTGEDDARDRETGF